MHTQMLCQNIVCLYRTHCDIFIKPNLIPDTKKQDNKRFFEKLQSR